MQKVMNRSIAVIIAAASLALSPAALAGVQPGQGVANSSVRADRVVDQRPAGGWPGDSSGVRSMPDVCRAVDSPAAVARLTPAQRDAVHAACQSLGLAFPDTVAHFSATVESLRTRLQDAKTQLESVCQEARARGDRGARVSAQHVFASTVQELRSEFTAARDAEQLAFKAALDQFRVALRGVLSGPKPSSPRPGGTLRDR